MPAKVIHGARVLVGLFDPNSQQTRIVGLFSNCSYGLIYDWQGAPILGRYTVAELQHTAVEPVQIQCSGYRVYGHSWHADPGLPAVQNLLLYEPIELVILDRQAQALGAEPRIVRVSNVLPVSGHVGFQVKTLSEISVSYVGIISSDESVSNSESAGAASLP